MVGVNREAVEEAEHLTKFASTVHWITQTDPKADDEHAQALLASPNVKHWSKTRMLEIEGDTSGVTQVRVRARARVRVRVRLPLPLTLTLSLTSCSDMRNARSHVTRGQRSGWLSCTREASG